MSIEKIHPKKSTYYRRPYSFDGVVDSTQNPLSSTMLTEKRPLFLHW